MPTGGLTKDMYSDYVLKKAREHYAELFGVFPLEIDLAKKLKFDKIDKIAFEVEEHNIKNHCILSITLKSEV